MLRSEAQQLILKRQPEYKLAQEIRSLADKAGVFTLTGRLRAIAELSGSAQHCFPRLSCRQHQLALWTLWRAGYRIVNMIHDQILVEIAHGCDYEAESEKVRQLMVEGMKAVVPDVRVEVPKPHGSPVKRSWGEGY